MNKKILSILTILSISTLWLTSCNNDEKEKQPVNNKKVEQTKENDKENSKEQVKEVNKENKETVKKEAKKEIPVVYVAFATETMKNNFKDKPYNVFISDDNTLAKQAVDFFDKNQGKTIKIYDPKTKQTKDNIIRKYTPIHFFDTKEKTFDYEAIMKENPELIHTIKWDDWKEYFFFTLPLLGHESITLTDADKELLKNNIHTVSKNGSDNSEIIVIEDLSNPRTANSILSDSLDEITKDNNVSLLFIPLTTKTNKNPLLLTRFLILNKKDWKIDIDLLKAILKKQKELLQLSITDGSNIKEILKTTDYKDVDKLKTADLNKDESIKVKDIQDIFKNLIGRVVIDSKLKLDWNNLSLYLKENENK